MKQIPTPLYTLMNTANLTASLAVSWGPLDHLFRELSSHPRVLEAGFSLAAMFGLSALELACAEGVSKFLIKKPTVVESPVIGDRAVYERVSREASEEGKLEAKLRCQIVLQGNLNCSATWYMTEKNSLGFAEMMAREREDKHTNAYREIVLLRRILGNPAMKDALPDTHVHLVDIGCGNGDKAVELVGGLKGKKIVYFPIDISQCMKAVAISQIASHFNMRLLNVDYGSVRKTLESLRTNRWHDREMNYKKSWFATLNIRTMDALNELSGLVRSGRAVGVDTHRLNRLYDILVDSKDLMKDLESRSNECVERLESGSATYADVLRLAKTVEFSKAIPTFMLPWFDRASFASLFVTPVSVVTYMCGWLMNDSAALARKVLPLPLHSKYFAEDLPWIDYSGISESAGKLLCAARDRKVNDYTNILLEDLLNKWETFLGVDRTYNCEVMAVVDSGTTDFCEDGLNNMFRAFEFDMANVGGQRIYLFLGQTAGNFCEDDRKLLFRKFYDSMREGDLLVVGVELRPDVTRLSAADFAGAVEGIRKNYDGASDFLRSSTRRVGIPDNSLEFFARYNTSRNDIEMGFTVIKPFTVKSQGSRAFVQGDEVMVATSHKFSYAEMEDLLEGSGFSVVSSRADNVYTSPLEVKDGKLREGREEYAVFMVQK